MNQSCFISIKTLAMFGKIIIGLQVIVSLIIIKPHNANAQESVQDAINLANTELWKKFIDQYGIIHDFVGEVPTPDDCTLGKPNAIGWWSPIENGPFFTGLYLPAACERAHRTGLEIDRNKARLLAQGLLTCASVSDVPGFIARGVGTDGKCHYPMGSTDQSIPWFYGLYCYIKSDIPGTEERKMVVKKIEEVVNAIRLNDWKFPCDGSFKGQYRDGLKEKRFLEVTCYLFVLKAMHEITHEDVWLKSYQEALFEKPSGSDKTRAEICSSGYLIDSDVLFYSGLKNINKGLLWIYVKNQASLFQLAELENDETVKAYYKKGLVQNGINAIEAIMQYKEFDNNDTKVFGHANWREGYPTWFPQKTQEDARRLSNMGDKAKLGERKSYERAFMTNPLAAAAIVAFAGDENNRNIIQQAIIHYDYSKLNLSEFFFAEIAYYAFPFGKN